MPISDSITLEANPSWLHTIKNAHVYTRSLLILAMLTIFSGGIMAQDDWWFEPDRPGVGTASGVVPFKKVMLECGFQTDIERRRADVMLPELQLRAGITRFAELRFSAGGFAEEQGRWDFDIDPLVLGTKVRFCEKKGKVPEIAMLAELAIPCTKKQAEELTVAPTLHLLFTHETLSWLNITYDVGGEWDGRDMRPDLFIALCMDFTIAPKWHTFVESYNYITGFKQFDGQAYLSAGFTYQVHRRVQLDISAAFNAKDPDLYSNVGVGIAWLIN